jgi:hypothetical protein
MEMDMTSKKELWVFDVEGKRKYDLTEELITHIIKVMSDLYFEWIIDFMRHEAQDEEWDKVLFIANIDGELYDLKRLSEEDGLSFMKSLIRDTKIQKIIE